MKNIVLTGFMGTGKTSVGKALSDKLKKNVVDVDAFIESRQKRKIKEIFEKDGEALFRKLEKEAIGEIAQKEGVIITTGGGAVLDDENVVTLKKSGTLIALWAKPETIFKRVKNSSQRPLLNTQDPMAAIVQLIELRKPYYDKADMHFETDGKTPRQVADLIAEALERS